MFLPSLWRLLSCKENRLTQIRFPGDWRLPIVNYVKLNVDDAFDINSLKDAVGAVLRDSNGRFLAASNNNINFCVNALSAEMTALRFSMNLA